MIINKLKIDSLGYDVAYKEKPISNLIDFDWKKILDPPPRNTDETTVKELLLIARETQKRNKKDIELIHNVDQDLDRPFVLLLDKYNLEYPQKYISLFYKIVKPVVLNIKSLWNRPRPSQLAKFYNIDIDVIQTDTHHTAAYPSGHTVYSNLVLNIIQDIYPKVAIDQLTNIVLQTAKARVMQGVHFPTDNKASLIFSNYVFKKLHPKLKEYING
jgi:hypothetical protein